MSEFDPFADEGDEEALAAARHLSVDPPAAPPSNDELGEAIVKGSDLFGPVPGPDPAPPRRYPEPTLANARRDPNASVFLEAWGEEAFLASAYFKAWRYEWRRQERSRVADPKDPGRRK